MDIKETDAEFSINSIDLSGTPTYTISAAASEYQFDYGSLNNGSLSVTGGVIGGALGQNSIYTTTTTGTGGYNWNIGAAPTTISQGGRLSLQGEKADIDINGRSMSDWMAKIEERLNILTPNPGLEKEWDELRRLGERYRKLEKKCKEKAEMWKQLKKMPAPRPDQF
jgi:hypothetical protein